MNRAFYLHEIPGYREAIRQAGREEFKAREDAWLALPAFIGGVKVRAMNVRDYVGLLRLESPFLLRTEPTFIDLGEFLWHLSPEIERWHNHEGLRRPWIPFSQLTYGLSRLLFAQRLRKKLEINALEQELEKAKSGNRESGNEETYIPEDCPLAKAIVEAFQYVDRLFIDKPVELAKGGVKSGLHYLPSWFDAIQSEYRKTDEEVYRMALPQLFARLKAIQLRKNPDACDFNEREDHIKQRIIQSGLPVDELRAGKLKLN